MTYIITIVANDIIQTSLTNVAFIFSGCARSFISPIVHQTIKQNLLEAFCPDISCTYDVFVRVSSNDNIHVGVNSTGDLIIGDDEYRRKINISLNTLKSRNGDLIIHSYEIGSDLENYNIENYNRKDFYHKIYRQLDPRRYSMFYSRWASHEMMKQHELKLGKPYVSNLTGVIYYIHAVIIESNVLELGYTCSIRWSMG